MKVEWKSLASIITNISKSITKMDPSWLGRAKTSSFYPSRVSKTHLPFKMFTKILNSKLSSQKPSKFSILIPVLTITL